MRNLIIYTHFNNESFTKAVVTKMEQELLNAKQEVELIDLYKDKFNPVLDLQDFNYSFNGGDIPKDVKAYQETISKADNLIFVFPLWWWQMPAILKGFFDKVFTQGFAFEYTSEGPKGLLKEKKIDIVINTGSNEAHLFGSKSAESLEHYFNSGLLGYCQLSADIHFFTDVLHGPHEVRQSYLDRIPEILKIENND
ncbi:NAD(P)H-dependent oxidoreductase [Halosquirtibacter xylanolyticus]|uniref:NAD(P)H-dependent oxidoreductase n=1 Tax=Halosquirtibacter xylanolyticus TaxID=3374599 RepID=UPI003747D829|nr:NAD(P)H-dependent oxidoreductase [Prolixibacteraceae bacterium]